MRIHAIFLIFCVCLFLAACGDVAATPSPIAQIAQPTTNAGADFGTPGTALDTITVKGEKATKTPRPTATTKPTKTPIPLTATPDLTATANVPTATPKPTDLPAPTMLESTCLKLPDIADSMKLPKPLRTYNNKPGCLEGKVHDVSTSDVLDGDIGITFDDGTNAGNFFYAVVISRNTKSSFDLKLIQGLKGKTVIGRGTLFFGDMGHAGSGITGFYVKIDRPDQLQIVT